MRAGNLIASLLIFFSSMAHVMGAAETKKELHVGIVLRLEDKFNKSVNEMMTGIETAKTLFELKHPKVQIVFHKYSHTEDLSSVVTASEKVVKDQLPVVIGGEMSEESFVLRDQLGPKKIVFLTPTSSNPSVTEGYPFSFSACFSDRAVSEQLANFTLDHLNPKVIGVIHNISSPYTDFLSKQFMEQVKKRLAKTPIFEEKILRDTTDFSEQIKSFMDKKVTHIAMLAHQTDLLRFSLQASKLGYFPTYIGSDGWGSNDNVFKKLVTESPTGSKFTAYRNSYWKEDSSSALSAEFKNQFKQMYSHEPNEWNAMAFDSGWLLFNTMFNIKGVVTGESVREGLLKLKDLPLVTTQKFSFNANNSPKKDLFIYKISKEGINYERTLR